MTTREELNQRIDLTLTLAGVDMSSSHARIVRGVLEGLDTPLPKPDKDFALLLRRIADDSAARLENGNTLSATRPYRERQRS